MVSIANSSGSWALVAFLLAMLATRPAVAALVGALSLGARNRRDPRAALGVGTMSGALVGEGGNGLAYVAGTTYPPYWWASIAAALVLLVLVAAAHRLPSLRDRALAGGVCAVVAAAFVAVYSQGSDLFSLLS